VDRDDYGAELGCHTMFAWREHGAIAGSTADLTRRPHVHPQ
jgi:hypothetical protein